MKNTQLINQLAVSVGKISYLFKSIRKSNAQTKQLEIALLKQYAVELYDQVLELERENKPHSDTSHSSAAYVKSKIAEKVKNIKEEAKELDNSLDIASFEEEKNLKEDFETSIGGIPAEISSGILLEEKEESSTTGTPKTMIADIPAEMSAGMLLDEEQETSAEVTDEKKQPTEEILAIESISKEETVMEMVAEVEKEVEAEDIHEDITDEDATSLMNIESDFFIEEPKVNGEIKEEDYQEDESSTVVFDKPSQSYTENLPIAEKLQRTLARLQETEQEAAKVIHSTPKKEDSDATTVIHSHNEDEDATTVIHSVNRNDGATSIINPNLIEQSTNDSEPEEIEEPIQPILTDDNSVRTQILDDIVKSSEPTQDHTELKMDLEVDADETVALELNDVLARNTNSEYSGSGRKVDVSFNQRFAFINQLFKGNSEAYNKAIDDIRHSEGYIQALTYVNLNLVHDYGWDSEDPVVKDFKEVIRKCFLD